MADPRTDVYRDDFYRKQASSSLRAAEIVVPLVMELGTFRSVVDVGCGVGAWLSVFARHGATTILGIDGPWVRDDHLSIEPQQFRRMDLELGEIEVERTFDLVVSIEVAEHLSPDCAASFVRSLTRLGQVVLFSAAVPYQEGKDHRNEQWPDYWAALFRQHDYLPVDAIRRKVWNSRVPVYCAQNLLLFVAREELARNPTLEAERSRTNDEQLVIVHPRLYERNSQWWNLSLRRVLRVLPGLVARSLRRRSVAKPTE